MKYLKRINESKEFEKELISYLKDYDMKAEISSNKTISVTSIDEKKPHLFDEKSFLNGIKRWGNTLETIHIYNVELYYFREDWSWLNIKSLNIINSKIETLLNLPNSLKYLNCSNNKLRSLPKLPETLLKLNCSSNQIKILPNLPPQLNYLNAANNKLEFVPYFNKEIDLQLMGNPVYEKIKKEIPSEIELINQAASKLNLVKNSD